MTRDKLDELLRLPAGREVDAAVAEFVMGWWVKRRSYPPFSTDLSDAYEAFKKRGTRWETGEWDPGKDGHLAIAWVNECRGAADTLPLAMCRAALVAAFEETK